MQSLKKYTWLWAVILGALVLVGLHLAFNKLFHILFGI